MTSKTWPEVSSLKINKRWILLKGLKSTDFAALWPYREFGNIFLIDFFEAKLESHPLSPQYQLPFHTLTGGRSKMTMSLEKLPPSKIQIFLPALSHVLMKLCQQAIATNLKISTLKWFGSSTKKNSRFPKMEAKCLGANGVTLPQRLPSHDPGSADNKLQETRGNRTVRLSRRLSVRDILHLKKTGRSPNPPSDGRFVKAWRSRNLEAHLGVSN